MLRALAARRSRRRFHVAALALAQTGPTRPMMRVEAKAHDHAGLLGSNEAPAFEAASRFTMNFAIS
jgi:hypothetical protein